MYLASNKTVWQLFIASKFNYNYWMGPKSCQTVVC